MRILRSLDEKVGPDEAGAAVLSVVVGFIAERMVWAGAWRMQG